MYKKSRTLVTGGRGFVGINLISHLVGGGYNTLFDNLSRPSPSGWTNIDCDFIEGDVTDLGSTSDAVQGNDRVVHLAAYGSVVESIADPLTNFRVNSIGTLNVLKACVEHGVNRMVFASTGGALIGDAEPPVNENSLPKPISPYGASKLCGEGYCHAFAKAYGLDVISTRFANVYGPHSAHKKGAVTTFMKALINDEPIVIYGDGTASRDYIYVGDLCEGIKLALDAPMKGNEVFHLASGTETTVLQLAEMLCEIAGKPKHPIKFMPARRGEVARNFASATKAREQLGFAPKMELREGLMRTWEWFNQQSEDILSIQATES